jgi:PST family polysaccharide transporter/lipopolysaccharide exporter
MTARRQSAGIALGWKATQLAGGQTIAFLRLIVLARLLVPADFGLVAVAAATIGVLMGVSNLGVRQALIQQAPDDDLSYDVAWTIGLARAAMVTALLMLLAPTAASLFGEPQAAPILRVMALRPLIDASASIGVTKLTRQLAFRRLAIMALPASIVDAGVAIALAPTLGAWALVAGILSGAVAQVVLSYALAPHRPRLRFNQRASADLVQFGRWILATGIVSLVGRAALQFGISRSLGAAALGQFVVASRLAFLPTEVASAVVGAVAFPLYASYRDDHERSAHAFSVLLTGQVIVLLPLSAIIMALAPTFEGALGAGWSGTAGITQLLTATCIVGLFGDAVVPLLLGRGRPGRAFVVEAVQTAVNLAFLFPMLATFGVPGAALAMLAGTLTSQFVSAHYSRQLVSMSMSGLALRRCGAAVIAAILSSGVAIAVSAFVTGLPGLAVAGSAAMGTAAGVLWILDGLQALRLREFLPWHAAWHTLAPAAPQPEHADA